MTNKVKIKPYCSWCHNEKCVNDECPVRGDYCPVPDISGLCRYEERYEMTPLKAWYNIFDRLTAYADEHGFRNEDVAAEMLVYSVLCEAEEEKDDEKSDD